MDFEENGGRIIPINIENEIVFDIMEHPLFQRMRRIKQLGLSCYVYPGAMHTRFQHSVGATFLMQNALNVLESKGLQLTDQERSAHQQDQRNDRNNPSQPVGGFQVSFIILLFFHFRSLPSQWPISTAASMPISMLPAMEKLSSQAIPFFSEK